MLVTSSCSNVKNSNIVKQNKSISSEILNNSLDADPTQLSSNQPVEPLPDLNLVFCKAVLNQDSSIIDKYYKTAKNEGVEENVRGKLLLFDVLYNKDTHLAKDLDKQKDYPYSIIFGNLNLDKCMSLHPDEKELCKNIFTLNDAFIKSDKNKCDALTSGENDIKICEMLVEKSC